MIILQTRGGGGGVGVNGHFTMNGGEISRNIAEFGGGVAIGISGTAESIPIGDGEISRSSSNSRQGIETTHIFIMNGGIISENTAINGDGGGVHVLFEYFIMNEGTIANNTATNVGGGVYLESRRVHNGWW